MTTKTEYHFIAFGKERLPGGCPGAFDARRGGSIMRETGDGRDDVFLTMPNKEVFEVPWSQVKVSKRGKPVVIAAPEVGPKDPPVKHGRVRPPKVDVAPPAEEPEIGEEPDEIPPEMVAARAKAGWSPPKPPNPKKVRSK